MTDTPCPVCCLPLVGLTEGVDRHEYRCENCGEYSLTGTALAVVRTELAVSPELGAVLAHAIRRRQRTGASPTLDSPDIKRLKCEGVLPDPKEQAENVVLLLGDSLRYPGRYMGLDYENLRAQVGAYDAEGVAFIVDSLKQEGLVETDVTQQERRARLSLDGWKLFHQLTRGSSSGHRAFMAMQYGDETLDRMFADHFRPAADAAGFDLFRLIEEPKAGSIDERLRVEIRRAAFVVADLTHGNQGAYWEAGFAEGLGKPVIYTCRHKVWEQQRTHFDTNHLHTVIWDEDVPDDSAEELKATIRATLPEEGRMDDPPEPDD